jgi:hypothetical protein
VGSIPTPGSMIRRNEDTKLIPGTAVVSIKDDGSEGFPWATHTGPKHEANAQRQVEALATHGCKARVKSVWIERKVTKRDKRSAEGD